MRAPFKHQFKYAPLLATIYRVYLFSGDDTAAHKLGKERQRQVINLKIEWTQEQDVEDLVIQMTPLLQGTLDLGEIVYINQFVLHTARV